MTAIDALVAEAIASAGNTMGSAHGPRVVYLQPKINFESGFFGIATSVDSADCSLDGFEPDGQIYVRKDVFDAALAHLAARAVEAEGRAERAEARADEAKERAIQRIVEVLDIVNRHEHCADARRAIEALVSGVEEEDAEEEAPRG